MFYDKLVALCKEKGVSPSAVAEGIGLSRAAVTKWKNEKSSPNMKTLVKLAEYFGVSTDYFREEPIVVDTSVVSKAVTDALEQKEKPPTMDGRVFELITICNQLTDENLLKVADYIRYLLSTQA